jgi:hypothetical protein
MAYVQFGDLPHKVPEKFATLGVFPRKTHHHGMFWHWVPFKKIILEDKQDACPVCTLDMLEEFGLLNDCADQVARCKADFEKRLPCDMCDKQSLYMNQYHIDNRGFTFGPLYFTGEYAGMVDERNKA